MGKRASIRYFTKRTSKWLIHLISNLGKSNENYSRIYFTRTKWVKHRKWTKKSNVGGDVEERACSRASGCELPPTLREWSAVIWKIKHRTLTTDNRSPGNKARSTRDFSGFSLQPCSNNPGEHGRVSVDMGFVGHSYSRALCSHENGRGLPRTARAIALKEPKLHNHTTYLQPWCWAGEAITKNAHVWFHLCKLTNGQTKQYVV